jgi:DNA-binding response OmpR family regulator
MNKTVLIVDDFASVRLYHKTFLARKGFRCLTAGDGAEALEVVQREQVDLVVLDRAMPKMSGEEFLVKLDALPAYVHLPVLMITAELPQKKEGTRGTQRPLRVLTKPVLPGNLLKEIQRLLP